MTAVAMGMTVSMSAFAQVAAPTEPPNGTSGSSVDSYSAISAQSAQTISIATADLAQSIQVVILYLAVITTLGGIGAVIAIPRITQNRIEATRFLIQKELQEDISTDSKRIASNISSHVAEEFASIIAVYGRVSSFAMSYGMGRIADQVFNVSEELHSELSDNRNHTDAVVDSAEIEEGISSDGKSPTAADRSSDDHELGIDESGLYAAVLVATDLPAILFPLLSKKVDDFAGIAADIENRLSSVQDDLLKESVSNFLIEIDRSVHFGPDDPSDQQTLRWLARALSTEPPHSPWYSRPPQ